MTDEASEEPLLTKQQALALEDPFERLRQYTRVCRKQHAAENITSELASFKPTIDAMNSIIRAFECLLPVPHNDTRVSLLQRLGTLLRNRTITGFSGGSDAGDVLYAFRITLDDGTELELRSRDEGSGMSVRISTGEKKQ